MADEKDLEQLTPDERAERIRVLGLLEEWRGQMSENAFIPLWCKILQGNQPIKALDEDLLK